MRHSLRRNIIYGLLGTTVAAVVLNFLWAEVELENQLRELDQYCMSLKVKTPLYEIQTRTALSPTLRLILLEASADGSQMGSIYFDGSGRWACSVSFMNGRLMRRSFGGGNLARDPNAPPEERLKPW